MSDNVIDLSNLKPEKKAPEPPKFTCSNCASFHRTDKERGECHRLPPQSFLVMQSHPMDPSQQIPGFLTTFPGVTNSMFCDEWNEEVPDA